MYIVDKDIWSMVRAWHCNTPAIVHTMDVVLEDCRLVDGWEVSWEELGPPARSLIGQGLLTLW